MLPLIGDSFGLTNAQMGAITSTYFLAYICMQVPAGLLGDRMGLKNILGISVVLAGLALALIGLMSLNYWLLLVLIGLHGLAAGVYCANVYGAAISIIPEKNRSLYTAIINGDVSRVNPGIARCWALVFEQGIGAFLFWYYPCLPCL